jgi:hypothetical protein
LNSRPSGFIAGIIAQRILAHPTGAPESNLGLRPNWNDGTMELWNDGFKENGIQSAYYCIDFVFRYPVFQYSSIPCGLKRN